MRLGIHVPKVTWPGGPVALGPDLARLARAVDEGGFAYLSVMDHFFQIPKIGPVDSDMPEAYTTLGFLAGQTERVKLLTLVTAVHHRHPGLLAKAVTTLDVLSGGRAVLGIGAGWYEDECRGLGIPFPPVRERFERLEETLRYLLQMWSGNDAPFVSGNIDAERLLNVPPPLSSPRPPILVGGGGEQRTLRLVAQYADACNIYNGPELERKLDALRAHCVAVGRDYAAITKTTISVLDVGDRGERLDELKADLRRQASLGIDVAFLFQVGDGASVRTVELLAKEVVTQLAN